MKDLLSDHPLELLVLLPEPETDSGLKKLYLLGQWSSWFQGLNIEVTLCIHNSSNLSGLVQTYFPFPVFFEATPVQEVAQSLGCILEKPVFGKSKSFIPSCLILFNSGQIVYETRRINLSALQHLIEAALKIQTGWLKAHITDQIDTKIHR